MQRNFPNTPAPHFHQAPKIISPQTSTPFTGTQDWSRPSSSIRSPHSASESPDSDAPALQRSHSDHGSCKNVKVFIVFGYVVGYICDCGFPTFSSKEIQEHVGKDLRPFFCRGCGLHFKHLELRDHEGRFPGCGNLNFSEHSDVSNHYVFREDKEGFRCINRE
ncbi:hypothetical protein M422DRAFT_38207 [Sphaerobolus stellatus SS14]|uniref:C2H2-type domain-containing protein n=1 Tax=Sphaerobolus stellatus (strain SS14) TaxID=990650 RepID=A0A0C9UM02_SPHS4|nr:hypothetical protein M422DRAFT_38207 [Sphaerobolus stellatus SS14]